MNPSFYIGGLYLENGDQISPSSLPFATTTAEGIVLLEDSTKSTSTTTAATPNAVKTTYDLAFSAQTTANLALPLAGGTMTGAITFDDGQPVDAGLF
jgi:phage-related tail fiber protein